MFGFKIMVLVFVAMLLGCSGENAGNDGGVLSNKTTRAVSVQTKPDAAEQAKTAVAEIDRIHGMDIPESEKEQKAKQYDRKLGNIYLGRTEKSLLLLELSKQTRTRAAWMCCITRANSTDSRVVDKFKSILEDRDDWDERQLGILYSHIGFAGSREHPYLEGQYHKVKSDRERRIIAINLAVYGNKVGVPMLIKYYESDGCSEREQENILGLLRKLYKTDAGSDIEAWKAYIREQSERPEEE